MMNDTLIYENAEFGLLRATTVDGVPMICANDVCKALDIANGRDAVARLDDDEKGVVSTDTLGGMQNMTYVTEAGFYSLVLSSRKSETKPFRRWVTHDVIPAIRRDGGYIAVDSSMNDDDIISRALVIAAKRISEKDKRIAELSERAEADKPKVVFASAVESSNTSILIGELAKLIRQNGVDIGGTRLFAWMRDNGYLMRFGSAINTPTQRAMELGVFELIERTVKNPDGSIRITHTTKVTGKGQIYFINKFCPPLKERETDEQKK